MVKRSATSQPWETLPAIAPGERVFVVENMTIHAGAMVAWSAGSLAPYFCRVRTGPPDGPWLSMEFAKQHVSTTESGARAILDEVRKEAIKRLEREVARWRRLDVSAVVVVDKTQPKAKRARRKVKA